ncbi:MAG: T9SS type A sorting domain-containing protein, partial [Flavobacteriales bacterium]|nr:T9SS type A sorting domain-containing protein [Flavobacteriales bacterium]
YIDNINIEVFDDVEEQAGKLNHFKISPNPSTGIFSLNGVKLAGNNYTYELCDAMGRRIEGAVLMASGGVLRKTFDWSGLSTGLYYLQLSDEQGQSQVLRLIKN